jgi:hypothetical protein
VNRNFVDKLPKLTEILLRENWLKSPEARYLNWLSTHGKTDRITKYNIFLSKIYSSNLLLHENIALLSTKKDNIFTHSQSQKNILNIL